MFFATARPGLDHDQQDFLRRLVPWSHYLCTTTKDKANRFKDVDFGGVLPSVCLADILLQSEWGRHAAASHVYNNLGLLPVDDLWKSEKRPDESFKYKNVIYKTFPNWQSFFVHFADVLVFDHKILRSVTLKEQLQVVSEARPTLKLYNEQLENFIKKYNLTEFDYK